MISALSNICRNFYQVFLGILMVTPPLYASERCITIEWYSSPDSNTGALPVPNANFISLNNDPILFNTIPGTVNYLRDKAIQAHSLGCFEVKSLRIGDNAFHFSFVYTNTQIITGTTSVDAILAKGEPNSKILCQARQGGGVNNGYTCDKTVTLSLAEVDPKSAVLVESLRREEKKLWSELKRLNEEHPTIDELKQKLNQIMDKDLESLSGDVLRGISAELEGIAHAIDDLKKTLEQQRAVFKAELAEEKSHLDRYKSTAARALMTEGVLGADQKTFEKYELGPITIGAINIPKMSEESEQDRFDVEKNIYKDLTQLTLERLKSALQRNDRVEVALIIEAWSETFSVLGKALENRLGTASKGEQQALLSSLRVVREFLHPIVDDKGFFKDTGVPEDVKRTIQENIEKREPERARQLRDALNQWKKDQPTPEKEFVFQVIRGIGSAFKALQQATEDYQKAVLPITRLLDQTIEVAKAAGRIALVVTPLNDYVDFCEILTGREMCVPKGASLSFEQRAFTTLGLVIGTGAFWRKFGEVYNGGQEVKTVCDRAHRLGAKLSDAEKKVIEQTLLKSARVSASGKEYVVKILKSNQHKKTQDIERIVSRYAELEKNMKIVNGISLKEVVTRGKMRSHVKQGADEVSEVFKFDRFSKSSNHRYSIGGEMGDDALYGVLGSQEKAIETVFSELREPVQDVIIARKEVALRKVLDLTDAATLKKLEVDVASELLKIDAEDGFYKAYEVPQQIGHIAQNLGFDGIKTFSAQIKGVINLVIFNR